MFHNRRGEVKETSPIIHTRTRQANRIFSHKKTQSHSLLQKKPQILLMKWNDFLENYHMFKQLNNINNSLNSVGLHLKKKKQQLTICDVPYIQSEQVSVHEKFENQQSFVQNEEQIHQVQNSNVKGSIKTKSSAKTSVVDRSRQEQKLASSKKDKIIISVRLSQKDENENEHEQSSENFTDEEEQSNSKQTINNITSSQINFCQQDSAFQIAESLRKTACFSFASYHDTEKSFTKHQNEQKDNQQNVSHLNNQLKSKKVEVLLKLQNEQELRRQKAQKIIKEDRQYLSKLLNRR